MGCCDTGEYVEEVIGGSADGMGNCVINVVLLKCESFLHLSLVLPTDLRQNTDIYTKQLFRHHRKSALCHGFSG